MRQKERTVDARAGAATSPASHWSGRRRPPKSARRPLGAAQCSSTAPERRGCASGAQTASSRRRPPRAGRRASATAVALLERPRRPRTPASSFRTTCAPSSDLPAASTAPDLPLAARERSRGLLIVAAATPFSPTRGRTRCAGHAGLPGTRERGADRAGASTGERGPLRIARPERERPDHGRRRRRRSSPTRARRSSGSSATRPTRSIGPQFENLLVPADRERLRGPARRRTTAAGEHAGVECTLVHRDGRALNSRSSRPTCSTTSTSRGIVLNGRDISERKAFEEQLAHQAFHDAVTGPAEPRAVRRPGPARTRPRRARGHRRRGHVPRPRRLQDDQRQPRPRRGRRGAARGRRRRLEARAPADTAARFGGDEFAMLLEDVADPQAAVDVAERILRRVRDADACSTARSCRVRPSIGIALVRRRRGASDADELIRNADAAMYISKRDGKGGYRIFEAEMHDGVLERLELRADLQRAIDARPVRAAFQPVVRLDDGGVSGVEALVRWHHPKRGLVQPGRVHPAGRGDGPDRRRSAAGCCTRRAATPRGCRPPAGDRFDQRQPVASSSCSTPTSSQTSAPRSRSRARRRGARARDHRDRDDGGRRARRPPPRASSRSSACASRWTTSARAIRRSATSAASRSTSSRWTDRSSPPTRRPQAAGLAAAIVALGETPRAAGRGRGHRAVAPR